MRPLRLGRLTIAGWLPTRFPSGTLWYESRLERSFLLLLQADPFVRDVRTQEPAVTLPGRTRPYTPDALATWFASGPHPHRSRVVAFEVKPSEIIAKKKAELGPK